MTRISTEINTSITHAADLIKKSHRAVCLTGAGVSTPSGIPDFRSPNTGLWSRYEPMEVASLSAFRHQPEQFYQWFHPLAIKMYQAVPNAAHIALARMQTAGFLSVIITQNIDGLHTRAGSSDVLEVHGSLDTMTCTNCYQHYRSEQYIDKYIQHCQIPYCSACGSILKPDIILYEEQMPVQTWLKAEAACKKCDLVIVAGSSLEVMPSARLPIEAMDHGAKLIILNNSETFLDERAEVNIHADVAEVIPWIAEETINA